MYTPSYVPSGDEVAVFKTNKGEIRVELFGKDAPIAVGNFVELVQKGFYDSVKFHRYVPGFVIQGGDPQTRDLSSERVSELVSDSAPRNPGDPRLGTGGPGYTVVGEFRTNPRCHLNGALAAARSQSPDSAGSQFYFTLGEQAFLDGQYTVFGQTVEGLDVIGSLRAGDVIEAITIENLVA
jgi:peptidyl-prolyl cis-trans isomerase B (cyclophilin B)